MMPAYNNSMTFIAPALINEAVGGRKVILVAIG